MKAGMGEMGEKKGERRTRGGRGERTGGGGRETKGASPRGANLHGAWGYL